MSNCESCYFLENDPVFGKLCTHKASMEGIEAYKAFYKPAEVKKCNYFTKVLKNNCN